MTSAYLCFYTGDAGGRQVLVVTKNLVSAWFGANHPPGLFVDCNNQGSQIPLPARIFNNPGQTVLPGGKCPDHEGLEAAAYREFHEETNILVVDPVGIKNERYFSYNNNGTLIVSANRPARYDFGVLYLKVDESQFNWVITMVMDNIQANQAMHNWIEQLYNNVARRNQIDTQATASVPVIQSIFTESHALIKNSVANLPPPRTTDNELAGVESLTVAQARQRFVLQNGPGRMATDWFITALDNIPA